MTPGLTPEGTVCIYGERVAQVLEGAVPGGAQLQMALIAKALAAHGIPVVIVDPVARREGPIGPGLSVRGVPGWTGGVRGLRFFTRRLPELLRTLRATGARLFYARGFTVLHLAVLYTARRLHARFVLGIASDTDVRGFADRYAKSHKGKAGLWGWLSEVLPNEAGAWIIRRRADAVCVQHEEQALLAAQWGPRVVRMNNIVESDLFARPLDAARKAVVIVGTLSHAKGLPALLQTVAACPGVRFEIIGRPTDAEGREAVARLEAMPNVRLLGPLARAQTLERIAAARALVNTSPREGFPNVFLEAWASGTPVVSLSVDPGGVIAREGLGYVCGGDVRRLAALLNGEELAADPARLRSYVREHHGEQEAVNVFTQLLQKGL